MSSPKPSSARDPDFPVGIIKGSSQHERDLGGKYLTFALGDEGYGMEILCVREIIKFTEITHVPRTPPHVRGVINLRGQVISVLDLRSRFDMEPIEATDETCIIVVESSFKGRQLCTGVIVDRVSEVVTIPTDNIQPPVQFGSMVETQYILGLGKLEKQVTILLDVEKILDLQDELDELETDEDDEALAA